MSSDAVRGEQAIVTCKFCLLVVEHSTSVDAMDCMSCLPPIPVPVFRVFHAVRFNQSSRGGHSRRTTSNIAPAQAAPFTNREAKNRPKSIDASCVPRDCSRGARDHSRASTSEYRSPSGTLQLGSLPPGSLMTVTLCKTNSTFMPQIFRYPHPYHASPFSLIFDDRHHIL